MKKISVSILLILLIGGVFAQNSAPIKMNVGKFSEEYESSEKSNINVKVSNAFNRMFANASNVSWTSDRRAERVYFETPGKATRAAFNKKGQFLYSITTYKEEYLPKDVLLLIKERYFGKKIFGVTEVSALNKTAYIIILEDQTSWLYVKVLDDEIFEEKVLLKAD